MQTFNPFEWFDVHGQRFFLTVVYRHELFCLALAGAVALLWRHRWWWWPVRVGVITLAVIYIGLFRMYWYSWVACPLIVATVAFDYSRMHWCQMLRLRLGAVWRKLVRELPASRRRWLNLLLVGVAAAGLVYILSIPSDFLWIVVIVTTAALLLTGMFAALGDDVALKATMTSGPLRTEAGRKEKPTSLSTRLKHGLATIRTFGLRGYVENDPRMCAYLDAVRRLKANRGHTAGALLAECRMVCDGRPMSPLANSVANLWAWVFYWSARPPFRWVCRLLSEHRWMPTFESAYVTQRVQFYRECWWQEYVAACYHAESGEPGKHLDQPERPMRRNEHRGQPVEDDPDRLRPMRLRWLAITEALAECQAFSDPPFPRDGASPGLLHAAELLNQAGELQHEIVRGLRGSATDAREIPLLQREVQLALHFFDLAAHCMETWLDPVLSIEARSWGIERRREHFCQALFKENQHNKPDAWKGRPAEYWIRRALLGRYLLLEVLTGKTQPGGEGNQWQRPTWWRLLRAQPVFASGEREPDAETDLAELASESAWASLWLELDRGDQARIGNLSLAHGSPTQVASASRGGRLSRTAASGGHLPTDRLAAVEAVLSRETAPAPSYRVREAVRQVVHLWALAVEQEMQHLHPGSEVWCEQCQLAANLYYYSGSLRIRRICQLARSAGVAEPPRPRDSSLRRFEAIPELG